MDLLHIAPEPAVRRTLPEGINYVTGGLEPKLSDFRVDITGMPFEDGTFDALICNHVMEHVPDDRAAFREFRRVLRPGGWGIVMTPISRDRQVTDEDPSVTDPEERERRWGQWDHVRQYGWDYIDRLKAAGLEVEVIDEYSPADVERYRLINPWGDIEPLFLISR